MCSLPSALDRPFTFDATIGPPVVFLSARYARREELRGYREDLRRAGFRVESSWLDGDEEISLAGPGREEALLWLSADRIDLGMSEILICFTEDPEHQPAGGSRGGRHVEFGLALEAGKTIYLVGPRENLFHWSVPDPRVFPTWAAALEALDFAMAWGRP